MSCSPGRPTELRQTPSRAGRLPEFPALSSFPSHNSSSQFPNYTRIPYTPHSTRYTLHAAPCTLHTKSSNHQPSTTRISELARELAASDSQRARLESACRVLQKGISEYVTSGGGAWAPVAGGFGPGGTSKTGGACGKLLAEVDEIRGGGDDVAAAAVASIRLLLSSGGGTTGSPGWVGRNGGDTSSVERPSGGDTGSSLPGGMLSRGDMEMAEEVIRPNPFKSPPPQF